MASIEVLNVSTLQIEIIEDTQPHIVYEGNELILVNYESEDNNE